MPRYLVVADQTLGGEQLMEEIRRRMAAGTSSFHVLVPQTRPTTPLLPPPADDPAWHRALLASEARLAQLISRIHAEGGEAKGELADPDPLRAIDSLVSREGRFDEIIISTLPTGVSRWLRMDLPHKVERRYKVPVVTVTAKRAPDRGVTTPRH
jgi:hypothetical protein